MQNLKHIRKSFLSEEAQLKGATPLTQEMINKMSTDSDSDNKYPSVGDYNYMLFRLDETELGAKLSSYFLYTS